MNERFGRKERPPAPVAQPTEEPAALAVPAGADRVRMSLRAVTVRGATVYPTEELERALAESGRDGTTLADVYRYADRLTRRYRSDGYVLAQVRVAATAPARGSVTLDVSEGRVGTVKLDDDGEQTELVREIADRIAAVDPLHLPTVERYVLQLNDLYGVTASVLMEPSREPGAVDLVLRVRRAEAGAPWAASIDNFGSRFLGPVQVGLSHAGGGLLTPYDRLNLAAFGSVPWGEVRFLSASYSKPLSADGTTLAVSATSGNSAPGYTLKSREIEGASYTLGVEVERSLIRTRREQLSLSGGLALIQVHTDVLGTPVAEDRLRVAEAGVRYSGPDGQGGLLTGSVKLSQGLDVLGATETGSRLLSRADGRSDFTKLSGSLARTQAVGTAFATVVSLEGQYAGAPLLSAEEFGFGGQAAGRGYDPSEFTGDRGVSLTTELRYADLPEYGPFVLQPFAFYDAGKVWDIGNGSRAGSSAGLGIRFRYEEGVSGLVYLAEPLTAPVAAPTYGNGKSPRVFFSLSRAF
ncbi:MAG: ShlB/FhaC/HecB family hemolysin secretion/activation protein [Planctomycetia bacterium]|nr:ShlB/FhaC/HecB family hemolysin secretion/activation protein [Planctomycetia bacterium]